MIQNIKVDIVYYMTATDFEFEFNLGSCCHMRLLNDKVKDRKSFVNSLARAVSRSQIIISCGPLFGETGLISTVAAAISHGLETVNNKAYGLSSDEKIEIIEGSVPLVTPEGYFGGCIIESGSQTIIVLTENRTIRKSIMKNLVHPYIEEISIMKSTQKAPAGGIADRVKPVAAVSEAAQPKEGDLNDGSKQTPTPTEPQTPVETEILPDTENESTETAAADEETAETENEEHNIEFEFGGGETQIGEETENVTEDSKPTDDTGKKAKGRGINISIIIIAAVLLLLVLALCYFLIYLPMKNGMSTVEYFNQIFGNTSHTGSV